MSEKQLRLILALCPGAWFVASRDVEGGFTGAILDEKYRPIPGTTPERPLPTMEALVNKLVDFARLLAEESDTDRFYQNGVAAHCEGERI